MTQTTLVTVEETEEQLITTAQEAVFQSNWVVGECAAKWTQRYARGRTDADFANLVGLSADQVYQRRRVWEGFASSQENYPHLKWSHYYASLTWDDAQECLAWANETLSTVAEMRAWRRARRGEDLTTAAYEEAVLYDPDQSHPVSIPAGHESEGIPFEPNGGSPSGGAGNEAHHEPALSVARETGAEGEYTPFRSGAAAPPAGGKTAPPPTTEQLTKRMTSALERFTQAMGRDFPQEFSELPDKVRARFLRAVGDLQEAVASLQ